MSSTRVVIDHRMAVRHPEKAHRPDNPIQRKPAWIRVRAPRITAGEARDVFGEGNSDAKLMFVGEGPGADEDRLGRPFVGRAGPVGACVADGIHRARDPDPGHHLVRLLPDLTRKGRAWAFLFDVLGIGGSPMPDEQKVILRGVAVHYRFTR